MKVPLLDLKAQYQTLQPEILAALDGVLREQQGILGPEVVELEKRVAAHCRAKFGVAVASGSDALLIPLMAMGVGREDGVLTTPFTFFATVGSISRLGARPFFADIDSRTFNIDPKATAKFLEKECVKEGGRAVHQATRRVIKAIIPVHLYGQCADMTALMELAREWDLFVVEDACQSIGASFEGVSAGAMGQCGSLSFFPSKNLGGMGDGGMIITQDEALAESFRILRVHGSRPKYYHKVVGINSRLDTLQAAILLVKLKHLERWTESRRKHAEFYDQALSGLRGVRTPFKDPRSTHVYNQYCIRAEKRYELRDFLQARGVGTEIYYPLPLHLQECFKDLGHGEGDFPESEKAARETLALPVYPELSEVQLQYVADCIRAFYG
jgi:dTDP-4-amino-4,6-dideoxygalactose transaminase